MEQTLHEHEEMIENHEVKLTDIQQNLIDIKTRLGIKDLTNGQVVEYQKQLADKMEKEKQDLLDALHEEKVERKASDEKLDERLWYITTGIIISILLEIAFFVLNGG